MKSYGNIGPVLPPTTSHGLLSIHISPPLSHCIKSNVSTRTDVWAVTMMARDCSSSFSAVASKWEPSNCTNKQRCYVPVCAYQRMYLASNKDSCISGKSRRPCHWSERIRMHTYLPVRAHTVFVTVCSGSRATLAGVPTKVLPL